MTYSTTLLDLSPLLNPPSRPLHLAPYQCGVLYIQEYHDKKQQKTSNLILIEEEPFEMHPTTCLLLHVYDSTSLLPTPTAYTLPFESVYKHTSATDTEDKAKIDTFMGHSSLYLITTQDQITSSELKEGVPVVFSTIPDLSQPFTAQVELYDAL
jgi:hypothetical protein